MKGGTTLSRGFIWDVYSYGVRLLNMINKNIHITAQQEQKLKKEKNRTGIPEAELVRRALDEELM